MSAIVDSLSLALPPPADRPDPATCDYLDMPGWTQIVRILNHEDFEHDLWVRLFWLLHHHQQDIYGSWEPDDKLSAMPPGQFVPGRMIWTWYYHDPDGILDKVDVETILWHLAREWPGKGSDRVHFVAGENPVRVLGDAQFVHHDGRVDLSSCCSAAFVYGGSHTIKGRNVRDVVCAACARLWDVREV